MPTINKLSLDGVEYDISNTNIEIGARIGTTALVVSKETTKEIPFVCPSAGYISVMLGGNGKIRIGLVTDEEITGGVLNGQWLWISAKGADQTYGECDMVFVTEGMKVYIDYYYAAVYVNFIPIEFYIK